ncbi:hypothetical protein EUX98_g9255 [Antrodiella citrinella]|uniref:Uncharacterized protein n=1 Tax=Antrodiella citrinella TaxID=2447956 RepID=A0A4S4LWH4_9APHY|nr:hypothetical protein EUX98_g9255 [Antrodiella citrinella]
MHAPPPASPRGAPPSPDLGPAPPPIPEGLAGDAGAAPPPPLLPQPVQDDARQGIPSPPSSADRPLPTSSSIPHLETALKFIHAVQSNPRLEDDGLDEKTLHNLRHAPTDIPSLSPDERLSIDLFLADTDGSEEIYNLSRDAILRRFPDTEVLTHHLIKQKVAELTGISPILTDMCPNTCIAYTGPQFAHLDKCPICKEDRYEPGTASSADPKARQQFTTFPVGPQIQARFRSEEGSYEMRHRERQMEDIMKDLEEQNGELDAIEDIYHGSNFWDAYQRGEVGKDDVTLIFSMDGAQLYKNKASNCWIYIWILADLSPDKRYKKKYILPGAIVPGPNKPKNADSFLFPGIHHVAALQNEGLQIWDAYERRMFHSRVFLLLCESDAVGAPELHGYVGHHGKRGCRNGCRFIGRRKPGGSHYYAVNLKPTGYNEAGCTHEDCEPSYLQDGTPEQYFDDVVYLCSSRNKTEYAERRLETGLSKPSIFMALTRRLVIPSLFPGDIMHLFGLNIPDLLVRLWRGTVPCDINQGDAKSTWDWVCLVGDEWTDHGARVAQARQNLPGSFDHPPRNPAEKINSGYKCWEYLHWIYGLAPALLYGVLPLPYWLNFCKLVAGVRIIFQKRITRTQLQEAHKLLTDFVYEFEILYVQRKISRMHFMPQCTHALCHTPTESFRIGPLLCTSQFPIERTIGDLGAEIRQPSNPFANLAQRALRRAQTNALKSMFPDLDNEPSNDVAPNMPCSRLDGGLVLLHPRERRDRIKKLRPVEAEVIRAHLEAVGGPEAVRSFTETLVQRWGRLRLTTGQICRSVWKESSREGRNIEHGNEFSVGLTSNALNFAEVRFYFQWEIFGNLRTFALVSKYQRPDPTLFKKSSGAVAACLYEEASPFGAPSHPAHSLLLSDGLSDDVDMMDTEHAVAFRVGHIGLGRPSTSGKQREYQEYPPVSNGQPSRRSTTPAHSVYSNRIPLSAASRSNSRLRSSGSPMTPINMSRDVSSGHHTPHASAISQADHAALVHCNNTTYIQCYRQAQELAAEKANLEKELEIVRNMYGQLVSGIQAQLTSGAAQVMVIDDANTTGSTSTSQTCKHTVGTILGANLTLPPPLSAADFPHVQYWQRAAYEESRKSAPKLGKGQKYPEDVNGSQLYIEDEFGTPVSGPVAKEMREAVSSLLFSLRSTGYEAPSAGTLTYEARTYLLFHLTQRYPYLRYCEANWKTTYLISQVHQNWKTTHNQAVPTARKPKIEPKDEPQIANNPVNPRSAVTSIAGIKRTQNELKSIHQVNQDGRPSKRHQAEFVTHPTAIPTAEHAPLTHTVSESSGPPPSSLEAATDSFSGDDHPHNHSSMLSSAPPNAPAAHTLDFDGSPVPRGIKILSMHFATHASSADGDSAALQQQVTIIPVRNPLAATKRTPNSTAPLIALMKNSAPDASVTPPSDIPEATQASGGTPAAAPAVESGDNSPNESMPQGSSAVEPALPASGSNSPGSNRLNPPAATSTTQAKPASKVTLTVSEKYKPEANISARNIHLEQFMERNGPNAPYADCLAEFRALAPEQIEALDAICMLRREQKKAAASSSKKATASSSKKATASGSKKAS